MKKTIVLFVIVSLISCTAPYGGYMTPDQAWDYSYHYNNYQVSIVSDPPGSIIEIDGEYVGKTPATYTLTGEVSMFHDFIIIANPISEGQYVQTKVISNPIPKTIYFNLNLIPTNNDYNININK